MSNQLIGRIIIVQESRFQLVGDDGVSHLFLLGANAAAEPDQLQALQRRQARVCISFQPATTLIGNIASKIEVI